MLMELQVNAPYPKPLALQALYKMTADKAAGPTYESRFDHVSLR
jgi:hypothetical protein